MTEYRAIKITYQSGAVVYRIEYRGDDYGDIWKKYEIFRSLELVKGKLSELRSKELIRHNTYLGSKVVNSEVLDL